MVKGKKGRGYLKLQINKKEYIIISSYRNKEKWNGSKIL